MSVDTYLYVDRKTFEVWMCIASCICSHKRHCLKCQKSTLIGTGRDLDEAIDLATGYDDRNPLDIEYGTEFALWCK